jgi:hypothetical protein
LAQQLRENAGAARPVRSLLQRRLPQERDFAVRTAISAALQEAPSADTSSVEKNPPREPEPSPTASTALDSASSAASPATAAKPYRLAARLAIAGSLLWVGVAMAYFLYGSMTRPSITAVTMPTSSNTVADSNAKVSGYPAAGLAPNMAESSLALLAGGTAPNAAKDPTVVTKNPPKIVGDPSALLGGSAIDGNYGKGGNTWNSKAASGAYSDPAFEQTMKNQKALQAKISKLERETKAATPGSENSGTYVGTYTASLAPGINRITTQFQQSGSNIASTYQTSTGVSGVGSGTISGNVGSMTWQNTSPNCPGAFQGTYVFDSDKVTFSANGQDCLGVEVIKGEARRVN